MHAIVYTRYGSPDVLQFREIPTPVPGPTEILVRVHATSATIGDCRLRKADPWAVRLFFGLAGPRKQILGEVFSGEIETVGAAVTRFQPGDRVFGSTGMALGAYAEYICLPETAPVALTPAGWSNIDAAAVPFGGSTALQFLQKAGIRPGQHVLVYGASGAVGSAAVQIAKAFGAEVTAVCGHTNAGLVRSLGADHVIDYTREHFWQNGRQYDVVYEAVNKTPVAACLSALKENGTLILSAAMLPQMLRGGWAALTGRKKVLMGPTMANADIIDALQRLMADGKLKPVVDRTYPLAQMAAAHAYVETGRKKGDVVITVGTN